MTMIGTSLCTGSVRTRLTSLSPSMMGMLMSVRMMSNLPVASLRSPSTPSSASVTRRLFSLDKARTSNWRIMGESSTTRHEYWGLIRHDPCLKRYRSSGAPTTDLCTDLAQRLGAGQPCVVLAPKVCRDERAAGVRAEKFEKLAIYGDKALLVSEQGVDHDRADRPVLELQRDTSRRGSEGLTLGYVGHTGQIRTFDDGRCHVVGRIV